MPVADPQTYLSDLVTVLKTHWPANRAVHLVCHGHSVPAGYFATPQVDSLNAYPHLLHRALKERFPYAVVNGIVTAIGGENAERGAARFAADVLCHRPDVVTIDYGLNDRGLGLAKAADCWRQMLALAAERQVRVLLCTPTPDRTQRPGAPPAEREPLRQHADQIRRLAAEHGVGLVDSLAACEAYVAAGGELDDLLSWPNHPNRRGHDLVARALLRWFPLA